MSTSWIEELASQEKERRKEQAIARQALRAFSDELGCEITADLRRYYNEFPNERDNIVSKIEDGDTVVTRLGDEESKYQGTPEVRFHVELRQMVVDCKFSHKPSLDKVFKIIVTPEGTLALTGASVTDLSRYLLTPVLFDKLLSDSVPSSPKID